MNSQVLDERGLAPKKRIGIRQRLARWRAWARSHLARRELVYWVSPLALILGTVVAAQIVRGATLLARYESLIGLMVREGTPLAIAALGAGVVLATGGVDLSSMGVAALSGVLLAAVMQCGAGTLIAIAVALLFGCLSGALVGWMAARDLPALISSWSIGSLWTIVAIAVGSTRPFGLQATASSVSMDLRGTWLDMWSPGSSGHRIWVAIIFVLIALLNNTYFARRCCAIGANRYSAMYAGVRVGSTIRRAYMFAGVTSSIAGLMWATLSGNASTTDFVGNELIPIAAAVIGGTVMSGGYFRPISVVASAFFWTVVRRACNSVDVEWIGAHQQHVLNALFALIILAMVLTVGRRLSGFTQTITTEPRAKESR